MMNGVEEERREEVLQALRWIADKSSPYSPYFDNMHEYQRRAETAIVHDWAGEMRRLGHSVCKIESNEDAPPDVLAVMDGKLTGIEVTTLVDYVRESRIGIRASSGNSPPDEGKRTMVAQCASQSIPKCNPVRCEWPLEHFHNRLRAIVGKKGKQRRSKKVKRVREQGAHALDWRLQRGILLIFTPEIYLQDYLAEYLAKTELSRSENFDRVFVMGDYVPDGGSGHYPVFEVCLSSRTIP